MIGYHAVSVLADMIVKGVKGFDYERAYEAMKTTALNEHYDCLPDYMRNGYVPFDKEAESVSKTLEYAYRTGCQSFGQDGRLSVFSESFSFLSDSDRPGNEVYAWS